MGDSQGEYPTGQRGSMVVGSAAVVVTGTPVAVVPGGGGMSHAFLMRCDLPVLVGMGRLRHEQQNQAAQPGQARKVATRHGAEFRPTTDAVKHCPTPRP